MAKVIVNPGDRYGRLTILKEVEPHVQPSGRKRRMVLVQCDCGESEPFSVRLNHLRTGHSTSCSCYSRERTSEISKKDLTGMTFSRLTVIKEHPDRYVAKKTGHCAVRWVCRCSCSQETTVRGSHLTSGAVQSCGCAYTEALISDPNLTAAEWDAYQAELKAIDKEHEYYHKHLRRYEKRSPTAVEKALDAKMNTFLTDIFAEVEAEMEQAEHGMDQGDCMEAFIQTL